MYNVAKGTPQLLGNVAQGSPPVTGNVAQGSSQLSGDVVQGPSQPLGNQGETSGLLSSAELVPIFMKSCSRKNMAVLMTRRLFSKDVRMSSKVSGHGKNSWILR